jgi:uncharacterized surface protein with fasciclin (FAS1) repeats
MTTTNQEQSNTLETIESMSELKTLLRAVEVASLTDTLRSQAPITFFAPTDEAFRNLPAGTLEGWLIDSPKLKSILSYHIVNRKITLNQLHDMTTDGRITDVTTLQGSPVKLKTHQQAILRSEYVNDAKIVTSDIETSNGIIQIVDRVLMPTITTPAFTTPTPQTMSPGQSTTTVTTVTTPTRPEVTN